MFQKRRLEAERFLNPDSNILSIASRHTVVCESTRPISSVLDVMMNSYRKIPVTKKGRFEGIVTLNDVLNYCGAGDRYQEFLKREHPLSSRLSVIADRRVITIPARSSIGKALDVFRDFGRGSFPVVRGGNVTGMVADWDILRNVRGHVGVAVGDAMVKRPAHVKESYSVLDVAKIMVRGGYRRLPVTKHGILTGIVLPSDILRALGPAGLGGLRKEKRPIAAIMNREPVSIVPHEDVSRAITLMLRKRIGGLPVTEDQELVGIITESDIVQGLL